MDNQTLQVIFNAFASILGLAEDTIVEDSIFLKHTPWSNQGDIDMETSSLLASFHRPRSCYICYFRRVSLNHKQFFTLKGIILTA